MSWSSSDGDDEDHMTRSVIEAGRHGARRRRRTRKQWWSRSLIFVNGKRSITATFMILFLLTKILNIAKRYGN